MCFGWHTACQQYAVPVWVPPLQACCTIQWLFAQARIANRLSKRKAADAAGDEEDADEEAGAGSSTGRTKAFKPQNQAQERVWKRLQDEYGAAESAAAPGPAPVTGGTGAGRQGEGGSQEKAASEGADVEEI